MPTCPVFTRAKIKSHLGILVNFPVTQPNQTKPKNVKKTRNGNLLVEVDSRRQAENIKIKTFHTTKCRAYPREKLNTSKGFIRSRELALATEDEIASALGKHGVTNIKRISIRKCDERIQTNTYILTFNKPQNSKRGEDQLLS